MTEATTYGASVAALQSMDEKGRGCEQAAQTCARGVQGMTASLQALDAALRRFKLDDRTLGASRRLQDSSRTLQLYVDAVTAAARRLGESTQAALQTVGQHRQLAQAVQEHGGAAEMGWYRGGR